MQVAYTQTRGTYFNNQTKRCKTICQPTQIRPQAKGACSWPLIGENAYDLEKIAIGSAIPSLLSACYEETISDKTRLISTRRGSVDQIILRHCYFSLVPVLRHGAARRWGRSALNPTTGNPAAEATSVTILWFSEGQNQLINPSRYEAFPSAEQCCVSWTELSIRLL